MKNNKLKPLKIITFLCLVFLASSGYAQSLSINFENDPVSYQFSPFSENIDSVNASFEIVEYTPYRKDVNLSATVAKIVRKESDVPFQEGLDPDLWAGYKLKLNTPLKFNELECITMKIYTKAPVCTKLTLKLENGPDSFVQRDAYSRVTDKWQTIFWDFTGTPSVYDEMVFMFDRDKIGDGSEQSTFYFDDIRHVVKKPGQADIDNLLDCPTTSVDNDQPAPPNDDDQDTDSEDEYDGDIIQIDLPVNFDEPQYNYTLTDFGGNEHTRVKDPEDENNKCIKVIKTNGAATWAGTNIGIQNEGVNPREGFTSIIPISLTKSKMSVRVWAPRANMPIMLKIENSNNPTLSCETITNTNRSGWQTLTFDFLNERQGTAELGVALGRGMQANLASIFFDYGRDGRGETFYFDDVEFVE